MYGTLTRRFAARAVARPELQLVVRVKALQERPGGLVHARKQASEFGFEAEKGRGRG